MNSERLYEVSDSIKADFEETQIIQHLNELVTHLQNAISQPQQPQHQEAIATTLETIRYSLANAPSNAFTPAWKQILDEMKIADFFGSKLLNRIEKIFQRNQITLTLAHKDIDGIYSGIVEIYRAIENMIDSFDVLNIGQEALGEGECEVGVVIPRHFVNDNVKDFGKEIVKINNIFGVFSEIAEGNREDLKIRSISSSDLTLYILAAPSFAYTLATSIKGLLDAYDKILDIRLKRRQLNEDSEVPEKFLDGLNEFATEHMESTVEKIALEIIENSKNKKINKERKNELHTELLSALRSLAKRIDNGVNIEIRAEQISDDEEGEKDSSPSEMEKIIDQIQLMSKEMRFLNVKGSPILQLKSGEDGG